MHFENLPSSFGARREKVSKDPSNQSRLGKYHAPYLSVTVEIVTHRDEGGRGMGGGVAYGGIKSLLS